MPPKKPAVANKLHGIRSHEKQFHEGVEGVTSYFTPSLVEICAKVVADTFPEQPRVETVLRSRASTDAGDEKSHSGTVAADALRSGEQLLQLVTFQLSVDLPLDVCIRRVTAEEYWKARCEARWPRQSGQLPAFIKYKAGYRPDAPELVPMDRVRKKMEPDWKRTYLERHLEEFAMGLDDEEGWGAGSGEAQVEEIAELAKLTPDRVKGLWPTEVFEMLCRLAPEMVQELNLDQQRAHLDWQAVFDLLPNIRSFRATFAALDVGMNFRLKMFGIRKDDIVGKDHDKDRPPRGLVKVLRDTRFNLQHLALPENQIDDEKTKGLLLGLIQNRTVEILDLSHNKVSDDGAKAIATLLMKKGEDGSVGLRIKKLDLGDNLLGVGAGKALGRALMANTALKVLSLKLNRLTDEGGAPVVSGLRENKSLKHLNLSNNELALKCVEALAETLQQNDTLEQLLATGNIIGEEGGARLVEAARANSSLMELDVRSSGVSSSDIASINALLKERVDQQKSVMETEKERVLREEVEAAAKDWKGRFYLGE